MSGIDTLQCNKEPRSTLLVLYLLEAPDEAGVKKIVDRPNKIAGVGQIERVPARGDCLGMVAQTKGVGQRMLDEHHDVRLRRVIHERRLENCIAPGKTGNCQHHNLRTFACNKGLEFLELFALDVGVLLQASMGVFGFRRSIRSARHDRLGHVESGQKVEK